MEHSFLQLALIGAAFVIAGLVKGVTGMGLPTVAMGVLGALISPLAAASLLLVPSFVTNLWQLLAGPSFATLLRRLWPMMAGVLAGTVAGAAMLAGGETGAARKALGAVLLVYALYTLLARPFRVSPRAEPWLSPAVGLITGTITGATGVFVIPAVPYLQSLGLQKEDLVQALGLSFTISTVALGLGLGVHGGWQGGHLALSVLAILPAMAGMWLGQRLRHRISPAVFRRCFLLVLAALGTEMLLR